MTTALTTVSTLNKDTLTKSRIKVDVVAPMPVEARISAKMLAASAANDALYNDLENRYGGAFAQWVVDSLNRSNTKTD